MVYNGLRTSHALAEEWAWGGWVGLVVWLETLSLYQHAARPSLGVLRYDMQLTYQSKRNLLFLLVALVALFLFLPARKGPDQGRAHTIGVRGESRARYVIR